MPIRSFVSFFLLFAAAILLSGDTAVAQQFAPRYQQPRQAYYQPPTREQQQQHMRTAYQESGQGMLPSTLPQTPTIQDRAEAMLRRQHQSHAPRVDFSRPSSSQPSNAFQMPRHMPSTPVKFRQQDDPFGSDALIGSGAQETQDANQFNPFADPPSETPTQTTPPAQDSGFNPFGNDMPDPVEPPRQDPGTIPGQGADPFADPPGMQDPVLPDDASPIVDDMPSLDSNPPKNNQEQEYPDGSVLPGGEKLQDPFRDPTPEVTPPESQRSRSRYNSDGYRAPAGVYRPPNRSMPPQDMTPAQSVLPPIVQPSQATPYEMQQPVPYAQDVYGNMGQGNMGQAMPPVAGYDLPYQPIPYTEPRPNTQSQFYAPPQPVAPQPLAMPQAIAPVAPSNHPQVVTTSPPAGNVYQGVIPSDSGPRCPGTNCTAAGCSSCGGGSGNASDCPDFYMSFFGGVTNLDLTSLDGGGSYFTDDGSAFGLALGRRNGRNLRSEIEFTARNNDIRALSIPGTNNFGDLTSYSGMANAYWEFIDVPNRCFKPYIGAGVGFVSIDSTLGTVGSSLIPDGADNDTSFAYQVMAGINYKAYRNMDLFAEYRVFQAESYQLETTLDRGRYDYQVDNILFGMRWKF